MSQIDIDYPLVSTTIGPARRQLEVPLSEESTVIRDIFRFGQAPLLAAALGIVVGTGGVATTHAVSQRAYRTGTSLFWNVPKLRSIDVARISDATEQLLLIRRVLAPKISELAAILRVQRPTVYAWLRGEWEPRPAHVERIGCLYRIAERWVANSGPRLGRLSVQFAGSVSLLDLLKESDIDETMIHGSLAQLRARVEVSRVERKRRSVKEVARRHGFGELSASQKQAAFDRETSS